MAANAGIYAIIVLVLLVLIVLVGFTCYMFRNFCQSAKRKQAKRQSVVLAPGAASLLAEGASGSASGSQVSDRMYKTTTDDDNSHKAIPTFEQILREQEKSAFSLHSLKLQQQQQQLSQQLSKQDQQQQQQQRQQSDPGGLQAKQT